ncbi:MAG: hypothetical protein QOG64_1146 [Acidimicrobiaceae bacterium]|nr:hypothetical protein [Acidimicrobiaceae bacterium]
MPVRWLDRTIPAPDAGPALGPAPGGADHPMRTVTQQIAFEAGWSAPRRAKVAALFDDLAEGWDARYAADPTRSAPLADALSRGGRLQGPCLEVGSGTGQNTGALERHLGPVISVDLSGEMLRRAGGRRVQADAVALPVPDRSAGTIVLVNAFLFPAETDRVLAADGSLVWVNTSGSDTPIHLTPEAVEEALPGHWHGVAADAGRGLWAVFRRA